MRSVRLCDRCLVLVLIALILPSCGVKSPLALSEVDTLPPSERIVFGRVDVVSRGRSKSWDSPGERHFDLFVVRNEESIAVAHRLTGDGSFYWHLRPGNYSIVGFQWSQPGAALRLARGHIFAHFVATETPSVLYIGTLIVSFASSEPLEYSLRVEDNYERAAENLKTKFPGVRGEVATKLMYLETRR